MAKHAVCSGVMQSAIIEGGREARGNEREKVRRKKKEIESEVEIKIKRKIVGEKKERP